MSTIRVRVPITCTVNILPVIITGEHSYWSGIIWGAGYVYHFQFVTLSKHLNLINTDHVTFIICIIVTVKVTKAAIYRFIFKPQEVTVEIISIPERHGGVTLLQVPLCCCNKTPNLCRFMMRMVYNQ